MVTVPIGRQPDDSTCGPTCLHAIYEFYGDSVPLEAVIHSIYQFEEGGTLGALLATDALERGYDAEIYSYNLQIFDPTWSGLDRDALIDKLRRQMDIKTDPKFRIASQAYIRFLDCGGRLRFEDLSGAVLHRHLKRNRPMIAGLSATYLYQSARECGLASDYDDLRGEPAGHFVVLQGYDTATGEVSIADPLAQNPFGGDQFYRMPTGRVLNAILLGIVTYDANLIVITPQRHPAPRAAARTP